MLRAGPALGVHGAQVQAEARWARAWGQRRGRGEERQAAQALEAEGARGLAGPGAEAGAGRGFGGGVMRGPSTTGLGVTGARAKACCLLIYAEAGGGGGSVKRGE